MFQSGLYKPTSQNLAILVKKSFISQFYLAGGTAVALHFGHRLSFDLDFFSEQSFDVKHLLEELGRESNVSVERIEEDTLLGTMNGEKISFFSYKYPLISPTDNWEGVAIAGKEDLIAMKLDAISNRGALRDFIDLYVLHAPFSLDESLSFYEKKYGVKRDNMQHIIRSLVYFDDAEKDEPLQMLTEISWEKVKDYFQKEVIKISEKML